MLEIKPLTIIKIMHNKYPWLNILVENISDYMDPGYYDKLLKDYVFNGKNDLQIMKEYLQNNFTFDQEIDILEIGCGTGRASEVALDYFKKFKSFDLVDLSTKMMGLAKQKLNRNELNFIKEDSIQFMADCTKKYNLVFSLWNLAHSIQPRAIQNGLSEATKYVKETLQKFCTTNLKDKGKLFIFHYDSLSEEQKILTKQKRKYFDIFSEDSEQSYSKKLLDDIFSDLHRNRVISVKTTHYLGDPIEYNSLDEALEIFMNFHLESEFNNLENTNEIVEDIENDLKLYENNGKYLVAPGLFVYEIAKV